ncbi:MAG: hypothetical protein ACK5M3_08640 [Dysgonomonas sp.]
MRFLMKIIYTHTLTILFVFLLACSSENDNVQSHLDAARKYYLQGDFALATQEIDSIKILYPNAIEHRKAGVALLDSVRRGENTDIIYNCDSLIKLFEPKVENTKKMFVYQRNKQYQEEGSYIPREQVTDHIVSTTLRSGVAESGQLYIESVFVGAQKHKKLKVSLKDGSFAETHSVTDDGLNYRFSNMGKGYEVIRFAGTDENGVGKFIFSNSDKSLMASIGGGTGNYAYALSQITKSAIAKSYQLSIMMIQLDSLKTEKEKAEFRIYSLDNKEKKATDL